MTHFEKLEELGNNAEVPVELFVRDIHKMDAKVELSKESSVWYKGEVCIQIVFPVPYIINRAYEIAESEKKRDLV